MSSPSVPAINTLRRCLLFADISQFNNVCSPSMSLLLPHYEPRLEWPPEGTSTSASAHLGIPTKLRNLVLFQLTTFVSFLQRPSKSHSETKICYVNYYKIVIKKIIGCAAQVRAHSLGATPPTTRQPRDRGRGRGGEVVAGREEVPSVGRIDLYHSTLSSLYRFYRTIQQGQQDNVQQDIAAV